MPAAYPAKIKGKVRVASHEHDSEEAVSLEEANHPGFSGVDPAVPRVQIELLGNVLAFAELDCSEACGSGYPT